jgi:hypothetical protein
MKSIIASTMYSGCSVGMVLVNKSLASRWVSPGMSALVLAACCMSHITLSCLLY